MVSRRQRWLAVATFAVGVLVLSVAGFAVVANRQTVTTVDDAVAAFRADRSTPPSPSASDTSRTLASPGPSGVSVGTSPSQSTVPSEPSQQTNTSKAGDTSAAPKVGSPSQDRTTGTESEPTQPGAVETSSRLTVPEEGVYTYATDGSESIDAFGGARHEYPDETTITVRHTGCGYTARWEPLRERWEEFDICGTDGRAWMRTVRLYHEFFGRGMRHDYTDTTVDTPMGPSRYVERFSRTLTDLRPRR